MHVPDEIIKSIISSSYYYKLAIENGTDNWRDFLDHLETHSREQMYDGTDD